MIRLEVLGGKDIMSVDRYYGADVNLWASVKIWIELPSSCLTTILQVTWSISSWSVKKTFYSSTKILVVLIQHFKKASLLGGNWIMFTWWRLAKQLATTFSFFFKYTQFLAINPNWYQAGHNLLWVNNNGSLY